MCKCTGDRGGTVLLYGEKVTMWAATSAHGNHTTYILVMT